MVYSTLLRPSYLRACHPTCVVSVFDLEINDDDHPIGLAAVDENQRLLLLTNLARAFQFPLSKLPSSEVRSRGENIREKQGLHHPG